MTSLIFPIKNVDAVEANEITKQQLTTMFKNISKKTKWNLDDKMLWGYFFTDIKEKKLIENKDKLVGLGYRFVKIYNNDNIWCMHVEKEEIHSVDSLFVRNKQLYKFSKENGIRTYDGMDVGPITNTDK